MMKKLVVVTDLGRFKAYRLEEDRNFSHPRLELLEDWQTEVNQHLSEAVTDQAGRFRRGTADGDGATVMSDGEQHNLDLERRKRALRTLAKRIGELLSTEEVDACYLAADSQINKAILAEMDQHTRARIQKNVTANLTRSNPSELASHFCS